MTDDDINPTPRSRGSKPGDRYRSACWRRVVQPGLQRLDDVTHLGNHNDYAYAGDDVREALVS